MKTIADLEAAIAARFTYVEDGPDKAWFNAELDPEAPESNVVYQTWAWGLDDANATPEEVEDRLVTMMMKSVEHALDEHVARRNPLAPALYWRARPAIDRVGKAQTWRLRMRWGSPGFAAIGHNPDRALAEAE